MASMVPVKKVVEVSKITPASAVSTETFSLPLTFFDTLWLKFHPVERIFFYEVPNLSSTHFHSFILPKLKRSLAVTLHHFLPLAGNLTWPESSPKPVFLYTHDDGVSLTVAESDADFNTLIGDKPRKAIDSHGYIPQLDVSDTTASAIALQITLFTGQGFCIGISSHHTLLDGKSSTMFVKAWAHICREETDADLPPDLTPHFERSGIQDPDGLDMENLNTWCGGKAMDPNARSLELMPTSPLPATSVRATFRLSGEDTKRLREVILLQSQETSSANDDQTKKLHLSTFVLTFAYTMTCMVKAKRLEPSKKVLFGLTADCRGRLVPPLPGNYFGNCVSADIAMFTAEAFLGENGLWLAAKRLSEMVLGFQDGHILERIKGTLTSFSDLPKGDPDEVIEMIGVAGSTRFVVYEADFGWGRPNKVEITSIDRNSSFSFTESRDGSGGVEVGVVMNEQEMEMFGTLFVDGFKDICQIYNIGT